MSTQEIPGTLELKFALSSPSVGGFVFIHRYGVRFPCLTIDHDSLCFLSLSVFFVWFDTWRFTSLTGKSRVFGASHVGFAAVKELRHRGSCRQRAWHHGGLGSEMTRDDRVQRLDFKMSGGCFVCVFVGILEPPKHRTWDRTHTLERRCFPVPIFQGV